MFPSFPSFGAFIGIGFGFDCAVLKANVVSSSFLGNDVLYTVHRLSPVTSQPHVDRSHFLRGQLLTLSRPTLPLPTVILQPAAPHSASSCAATTVVTVATSSAPLTHPISFPSTRMPASIPMVSPPVPATCAGAPTNVGKRTVPTV